MSETPVRQLLEEAANRRYSRRQLIERGIALGVAAPMLGALLASIEPTAAAAQETANPFSVDPSTPLDVLMWKAGWGDEYALNAIEIYKRTYEGVEVTYDAVQRVAETAQPRFVAAEPPDVIEGSQLDRATLVEQEKILDLTDLLAAPAFDTEGATLADTLLAGSQDPTIFNGKQYAVNFTSSLSGLWYSQPLVEEHGWTLPQTWDEMLALCEEIVGADIAPWTHQGKYPGYIGGVFWELAWKKGGVDPLIAVDNLESDAWQQAPLQEAAAGIYQLVEKGYILEGSEALTHTESQAEWLQGKAVFIPCGTWLENEMKDLIPEGFDMAMMPAPALADSVIPTAGVRTGSGQPFVVPSEANNPAGGKEFIRILCSKENARFFSEYAHSLTTIVGAADGLDLGSAFNSAKAVLDAAGEYLFTNPKFTGWYKPLGEEFTVQMGALMTKQNSPEDFLAKMQEKADSIAEDESIPKFHREK